MECINAQNCSKQKLYNLNDIITCPFTTENKRLSELLEYFLYLAPNTTSVHSPKIENCNNLHDEIYRQMLEGRNFKLGIEFWTQQPKIDQRLADLSLHNENICLKCQRGVCKKKISKISPAETNLCCLLRHIRNSIAHGRVYYVNNKSNNMFIMFEDAEPGQQNKSSSNHPIITARTVCLKADLEHWRTVLMTYVANSKLIHT
ncbi:MAG: HEPN family nuclease [Lachnospiraceae bacterium]|nr:HEPN family nuclease [Lachnospiraceae bacterium]